MNVVSFSGGRTSAYLCYLMKQRDPDCKFIYMDTGAEHPKTYEFIRKVSDHFKLDLICLQTVFNPELGKGNTYKIVDINDLKYDLTVFSSMMAKYGTPSFLYPHCTRELKGSAAKKYCDDIFDEYITWLGIRIDEPKRLKEMEQKQVDMFNPEIKPAKFRYLAEISDFEKQDVIDWWSNMPFDLEIPESLGNCVFCVKKGGTKIALASRYEPTFASEFISIINDESVRRRGETDKTIMYRGNNSLQSIIETYKDIPTHEIEQSIRSMKQYDSGSCSESCEAFSNNLDLFGDDE